VRLRANAGAVALPRPVRGGAITAPAPAFAPRAADALRRLPDHPLLERLLRGRAWIALIAVALGGIVAMQVSLLKLNSGIGRAVETSSTLERQNADLRATVSQLSSEERIQREAAAMGLEMPAAGDVRYLTARGVEDARRAASVMRKPNAPQTATAAVAAGVATQADPATAQAPVEPAAPEAVTPAAATAPAQPEQAAAPVAQTPAPAPAGPPTAPAQPQAAATGAATAPVAGGAE
jgi:cell division protein FtsL